METLPRIKAPTFCTGGIFMYFKEVGGAHYRGDGLVFDEREAVSADLQPAAGRVHR